MRMKWLQLRKQTKWCVSSMCMLHDYTTVVCCLQESDNDSMDEEVRMREEKWSANILSFVVVETREEEDRVGTCCFIFGRHLD